METSIQFAASDPPRSNAVSAQGIGGVVPLRMRSHSISRKRAHSSDLHDKIGELEDAEDEDAGLRDERDYKKKQVQCTEVRDLQDRAATNARKCRSSAYARHSYWLTPQWESYTGILVHRRSMSTRPRSRKRQVDPI